MEKKDIQDDLVIGKEAIEDFTGKKIDVLLFSWKEGYGFPIVKQGGFPAISKKALQAWTAKYGVDTISLSKVTNEMLDAVIRKKRFATMENTLLKGINEIANFVFRPVYSVHLWTRQYDSCPIKKIDGQLSVGRRDLVEWLKDNNIPFGHSNNETAR